jgi:hypothetical protein
LEAREVEFWKYVEAINWSGVKERRKFERNKAWSIIVGRSICTASCLPACLPAYCLDAFLKEM